MTYKEIVEELRETLSENVKIIAQHCEPNDYNAGRKSAFEDAVRMIDNYVEEESESSISSQN